MTGLSGKAYGILQRLPHCYAPEEAGDLLLRFVDVFGRRLERAEMDLYQVLHAHHVETADNIGSQGFTAPAGQRGDLDKIFALYLEALGGTSLLVRVNPSFTERSLNARRLARRLVAEENPLIAYLRRTFEPPTWELLKRYQVTYTAVHVEEIQPRFALELVLCRSTIAQHIVRHLSPQTRELLNAYTGGDTLDPRLQAALASDLNQFLLHDSSLFRLNEAAFRKLNLPDATWQLLNSVYRLDNAEPAETPVGDDQLRLNRLLLEGAFPYSFRSRQIPLLKEVRAVLVKEFNRLLEAADLYSEERFPEMAEDYPVLQKRYGDELPWLNRILLESAFPNEIEKSYVPYRERLRGLIQVLRRGASTRQGIGDIVAANLGIVDDDPQARAAKAQIEIEEYSPEQTVFFAGRLGFYQEFEIKNMNPDPASPEVWVTMLPSPVQQLANVRFVDPATNQVIMRAAHPIQAGTDNSQPDVLVFKKDSQGSLQVLLNTIALREGVEGQVPDIKPKPDITRWRFEADVVVGERTLPAGLFGPDTQGTYDDSVFAFPDFLVEVQVKSYLYTPGVFTVVVPYLIPGFTDKFIESEEHPRSQIPALVKRVKAAGVSARVAYKQVFQETQEHAVALTLEVGGKLLQQVQEAGDHFELYSSQSAREDQNMRDVLVLTGCYDLTLFESGNKFA